MGVPFEPRVYTIGPGYKIATAWYRIVIASFAVIRKLCKFLGFLVVP